MQKSILVILSIMTLVFASGCGNKIKTYPVTGKITYKGEPLVGASVAFSPKVEGQGLPALGVTDSNGVYKLQTEKGRPYGGTTPGEYIVKVSKTEIVKTGRKVPGASGEPQEETRSVSSLPDKYASGSLTPLKFTVEKKANTYDITIED